MNPEIQELGRRIDFPENEHTYRLTTMEQGRTLNRIMMVAPKSASDSFAKALAYDYAIQKFGSTINEKHELKWEIVKYYGCRNTGFEDWLHDLWSFWNISELVILSGNGKIPERLNIGKFF